MIRSVVIYLALAAAILVALGILVELRQPTGGPADHLRNDYLDSVAVMPLRNLTGDAALDDVGLGISEEIITHLARIPALKVISRHSAQAVSNRGLSVMQQGKMLNVNQVIVGALHGDAPQLQVTVQHLVAGSGDIVWEENFSAPRDYLIEIQEDIANATTARFVATVSGLSVANVSTHIDQGPGQGAYLAGQRWLSQRTPESISHAIVEFRRSIEMDPGYAPAYADLASAYALALFYRYDVGTASYPLAAQSLAYAERALALDPNLAAGFATRAYLGALIGQDAAEVAADFDRAVILQPNAASIPSWRARSLTELGQFDDAFSEASRAVELDPLAPGRHIAVAELSLQLGDYDRAIEAARLASTLEPRIIRGRVIEARALLLRGESEACTQLQLGPHQVLRASCLDASGRTVEAAAIIRKTLDDVRNDRLDLDGYTNIIVFEDLAVYFALQNDPENALFWSARAYAASPVGVEIRVLESALFERVRDNPDFRSAIAAIRAGLYQRVQRDSQRFR